MSNLFAKSVRRQRCITTCLSSGPSTNNTRGCGKLGPGTESADLYTLIGSNLQIFFRILDCSQSSFIPVDTYQNPVRTLRLSRRIGKPPNAVPAMRRRQHLNFVRMGQLQHHGPEIVLYCVVDSILGFVDKKESPTTCAQRQRSPEKTYCSVAKTPQRDWTILLLQADHRPSFSPWRLAISDYSNTEYIVTEYEFQCLYRARLIIRQRDTVPAASDISFARDFGAQVLALYLWVRFIVFGQRLMALEQ